MECGMQRQQVQIQQLLTGDTQDVWIQASRGRYLELETTEGSRRLVAETPVEIAAQRVIYLGVVESHRGQELLVAVEHLIDKSAMGGIHSAWADIQLKP